MTVFDSIFLTSRTSAEIHQWLTNFAQAVREVDFAAGRELFAHDVVSFGTINEMLEGRDVLEQKQWTKVWGQTRGFDFDYPSVRCTVEGHQGWAVALWSSQGKNAKGWFDRHGRATFIFEKRGTKWIAIHSHFSITPPGTIQPQS
ncbi:MAG TPA: nuclear transport factor 2 family protein [Tepidisphaeraceae bacterium]